jgi:hypothetical protein
MDSCAKKSGQSGTKSFPVPVLQKMQRTCLVLPLGVPESDEGGWEGWVEVERCISNS